MLDNIADLLLTVGLLAGVFGFPVEFSLRYMVPVTAIGVLVGDLLFFWMALRLGRRTGRNDITAMPLGLDTPSTFGMVFFVLGPAFMLKKAALGVPDDAPASHPLVLEAAIYTWQIGICSIFVSGLFKFACALGSNWIRRVLPRAGLLGSLTGIALVLISFLPLLEILQYPIVGFVALAVILTTLVARVELPFKIPGALGALIVGSVIYYAMIACGELGWFTKTFGVLPAASKADVVLFPTAWLSVFRFEWLGVLQDSFHYLPIVIPFALGTVIGGIDCTESAAAAGDDFHTGRIIAVEGLATVVAALCGGVIQTTPYIGHPAYKAMGGRAAYALATAIFVGSAGVIGYFGYLYEIIPKASVFPILIFIGLEITAQSFHATPKRHYTAVAIACVPALAALAIIFIDKLTAGGSTVGTLEPSLQHEIQTVRMLANGFIVTSLLWGSALAAINDRRLSLAAVYFGVASVCSFFGIMHSPEVGSPMYLPWKLELDFQHLVYQFTAGYALVSVLLIAWHLISKPQPLNETATTQ